MAIRIQQKRAKGWRKPEGAISVARPSRWGNPFPVARLGDPEAHREAIESFRRYLAANPELVRQAGEQLRGHDLMCYCAPDLPCHAYVWLELVNR